MIFNYPNTRISILNTLACLLAEKQQPTSDTLKLTVKMFTLGGA